MGQSNKCEPGATVCVYCMKDCKTPSLLVRHITVHTKEKHYVCECGRGYTRQDRFRKHINGCADFQQSEHNISN